MRSLTLSLCIALCSTLFSPVVAQKSFLYKWRFQDTSIQDSIPACQRLPIVVTSFDTTTNSTKGTPPYYMLAFPNGGTPSTTLIGTSDTDVSFTVNYPVGTRVLLSVVDSNGNPGGTYAPQLVVAGPNNNCVVTPSGTPTFAMTSNVTSELSTCEPLGVSIFGGTSPYVISLVAANAPSVTNVTLNAGDNIYTYINRAAPGGQLLAAISDAKGQWASGSVLLNTKGLTDTDCNGLVSSSSKGDVPPPSASTGSSPTPTKPGTSNTSSVSASTNNGPAPTSGAISLWRASGMMEVVAICVAGFVILSL